MSLQFPSTIWLFTHLKNEPVKPTGGIFYQTEKGNRKLDEQQRNGMGIIADSKELMLVNETKADSAHRRIKRSTAG